MAFIEEQLTSPTPKSRFSHIPAAIKIGEIDQGSIFEDLAYKLELGMAYNQNLEDDITPGVQASENATKSYKYNYHYSENRSTDNPWIHSKIIVIFFGYKNLF